MFARAWINGISFSENNSTEKVVVFELSKRIDRRGNSTKRLMQHLS
jgi:hypothetical protein